MMFGANVGSKRKKKKIEGDHPFTRGKKEDKTCVV